MRRIITPRGHDGARIVRVDFDAIGSTAATSLEQALKLGRGERCALQLDADGGPVLLCELERPTGSLRISSPLDLRDPDRPVEVLVDGEPLGAQYLDLRPGARVEVVERGTGRRYRVQVARPSWYARPRTLAIIILLLALAGTGYGAYVFLTLEGTRSELAQTERALSESIVALRQAESVRDRALRSEYDRQLETIARDAREETLRLGAHDERERERLARGLDTAMQAELQALEARFAERMVEAYENLKSMEARLMRSVSARLSDVHPVSAHFKQVLERSRSAIVFIRTTYAVQFATDDKLRYQQSMGTGFMLTPSGLAMSARHVFFPWQYDRELKVLIELDLARVVPESVEYTAWPEGARVVDTQGGEEDFDLDTAWHSRSRDRALRVVRAGQVQLGRELVESPLGTVAVRIPMPGSGDAVVFQLGERANPAGPHRTALKIAPPGYRAAALDDVLVLGFPLSRLADGLAVAQAVTGLVRHDRGELLELNIAFSPGVSGGPILGWEGDVIGLASGMAETEAYGLAVRSTALTALREAAIASIRADEARLARLGCQPGSIDGVFDEQTWAAYECEAALAADHPP